MRIVAILVTLILFTVTSCPRDTPPEAAARRGSATHPWELPGYQPDSSLFAGDPETVDPGQASTSGEEIIERPVARGPALSDEDTLVEADIPGQWLQVCVCGGEQLRLPAYSEMDMLELRENRTMTWQVRLDGQDPQYLDGYWDKPAPGQVSLQVQGNDPVLLYGQLHGRNFLYLWSYDQKTGQWFVRLPASGSERIARNRFSTTFGDMIFTEVGDLGFRGVVMGEYERSIGGRYLPGIIAMRWEETHTRSAGYAAFIVDPKFETLDGVWWLDDYEAAPFGGPWIGSADDSIEMPAVNEQMVQQD